MILHVLQMRVHISTKLVDCAIYSPCRKFPNPLTVHLPVSVSCNFFHCLHARSSGFLGQLLCLRPAVHSHAFHRPGVLTGGCYLDLFRQRATRLFWAREAIEIWPGSQMKESQADHSPERNGRSLKLTISRKKWGCSRSFTITDLLTLLTQTLRVWGPMRCEKTFWRPSLIAPLNLGASSFAPSSGRLKLLKFHGALLY